MKIFTKNGNIFRISAVVALAALLFVAPFPGHAQNNADEQRSIRLVKTNFKAVGLDAAGINDFIISKSFKDKTLGADMVYLQETYLGIPVYNSIKSVAFKKGQPVSVAGNAFEVAARFKTQKSKHPSLQPFDAIVAAAKYLELKLPAFRKALQAEANSQKFRFDKLDISQEDITTELLWVKQDNNDVRLAWQVLIHPFKSPDMWLIQVDATNGKVIGKANLTVSCNWGDRHQTLPGFEKEGALQNEHFPQSITSVSTVSNATYRVVPYPIESPAYGSFALVNNPWLLAGAGNNAGSLGWQNDGATDYNITRGNNVWAKEDRAADNETTIGVSATSSTAAPNYSFTSIFDPNTAVTNSTNQSAITTNLFYWNNIVHDIIYQYGFDEAAGNFQNNNQGRGGIGNDYVLADAQDGSGSNNANFGTPPDGSRPRMQMYLFSPAPNTIVKVNSSPVAIPPMNAYEFVMSANNKVAAVGPKTGNLVLYDNSPNTGCSAAAANAFTGKIVLVVYNGACDPSVATKNAQNAGAIGLIMQMPSSIAANSYSVGTDNTVTIPSVDINFADGNNLKNAMLNGTVNITLQGINLDGDLDNGVMVHEYGHGISNRLTGGPANTSCLQNKEQMGEGWSDYYALMMTTNWATSTTADGPNKRPLGNYVIGQGPTGAGIRRYPYTTDLSINKWNYDSLATGTSYNNVPGEVHYVGEIWAATLWDMTWNIIGIDGINTNLYNAGAAGGNSVAMKLVTQGLKLQPCSPGFIDGRDAILKADTLLYGGRYSCAIWRAFARRGMGKNASEGSSNSVTDQTIDYTLPPFDYDTTAVVCKTFTWYGTTYTASGIYTHTVDMPGGCSRVVTLHLTILAAGITGITPSAYAVCTNGSLTLTANGVTGPNAVVNWYTQPHAGGTYLGTGLTITTTLVPKTYHAVVTSDCPGDTAEAVITIAQTLTATFTQNDVACYGASNGSLTNITISGGTGPYTVSTSPTGGFANTSSLTGLKASTYRIYIMDANGCTGFTDTIVISQPSKIVTMASATAADCFGAATGSINITASSGGAGSYVYALSAAGPFGMPGSFSSLKAGTYRVYTRDGSGCTTFTDPITVGQPAKIVTTFTTTNAGCFGSATGSINNISSSGGTPSYTQSLSPSGIFSSVTDFSNLKASTYRIYTKDAGGCTVFTNPITISQSPAIVISFVKTDVSCGNPNSGAITNVSATGGSGSGYSFALNPNGPFTATTSFTGLKAGNYRVYAKDGNGCTVFTAIITIQPCIALLRSSNDVFTVSNNLMTVYPNPSKGNFNVRLNAQKAGSATITITNETGGIIETRKVAAPVKSNNLAFNLKGQAPGVYFVKAIIDNTLQVARVVIGSK